MNEKEFERVKADMEIIKEAAGLDLPFGWDSVFMNMVLLPLMGIYYLIFYFGFSNRSSWLWSLVPAVVLFAAMGYLRVRYRKSTGRSAAKRNEYGFTFYSNVVIGLAAAGYFWWARAKGLNTIDVATGIILMVGVFGILLAFFMKGRLYYLGGSIPLLLWGGSMMIWNTDSIVVLYACLTAIIGGIAMGCIQTIQIKASEKRNATY
jgi:hypothetical protein